MRVCVAVCVRSSAHGECLRNGECLCEAGFGSADCGTVTAFALCPGNCSGHGACVYGECRCDPGFGGAACDSVQASCPRNCSGHGLCQAQVTPLGKLAFGCECEIGFGGATCEVVVGGCPGNCTGHGACFNGTCFCDAGFGRDDCSLATPTCPGNCSGGRARPSLFSLSLSLSLSLSHATRERACARAIARWRQPLRRCPSWQYFRDLPSTLCLHLLASCAHTGHGRCVDGACSCHPGFGGTSCSTVAGLCPRNCSGHGECDESSARCVCDRGFAGRDCGQVDAACPLDCSGRGSCAAGLCECLPGYSGRGCEVACKNRCSLHGACRKGKCECEFGYVGDDCSKQARVLLRSSLPMCLSWPHSRA